MKKIYLTTAIPYVNGRPHVGHSLDYLLADVCARYHRLLGDEVRLQAGTDEHGGKIFQKAEDNGLDVQQYVDNNVEFFKSFIEQMGISYTDFVRTTDEEHAKRCQEIWMRLSDHIYSAEYEGWYCGGCERYITQKEYDENGGVCPDHQKPYSRLKEQNYYFRISDFKDRIRDAIESNEMKIFPEYRKREILRLIEESPDVSVSRPVSQLKWGVPVPGDSGQTMYVWIDALSNYLTVLGYPDVDVDDWWPAEVQFLGKDILRFHAIIWPAMLIGLGLPLPKNMVTHGFILSNGQKMSKSIGNVVDPLEVLEKHGRDAFRYYYLKHIDTFNDSDFTWEMFDDAYNNELANDLGNLVQRVATLAYKNGLQEVDTNELYKMPDEYVEFMDSFEYTKAFEYVWGLIQGLNRRIDVEKPWVIAKNGELDKLKDCLSSLVRELLVANYLLSPFLPDTADRIYQIFGKPIAPPEIPLFPKA